MTWSPLTDRMLALGNTKCLYFFRFKYILKSPWQQFEEEERGENKENCGRNRIKNQRTAKEFSL